jgi:peptidoglycan/LPS O-acetylase OafA/YrhL
MTIRTTDDRLSGLDGLRAIAVIAVVLFHADVTWARGGYLGVDLFFVISGFLITGLLVGEIGRTGTLALGQFYLRRAKRLLPASWLMIAAVVIAAAALAPDALPRLRSDALASLVYMTNWELILSGKSYFESMGRQPLLLHLWSLAIEEQFYIFWAPVIFLCARRFRPRLLAVGAALLAAASIFWMARLASGMGYPEQGDPTRLYFGTDTHGFSLLIGATLGLIWRPDRMRAAASLPVQEGIFLLGMVALAALVLMFAFMDEATAWLYPWGLLSGVAASAVLIVTATSRGAYFGRWLDSQPMRWIGERSYGIYLWHWPIYMLTRPDLDLQLPESTVFALRIVLTFGISALSYRFVEMPIRKGAIERWLAELRQRQMRLRERLATRHMPLAFAGGAVLFAAAIVLIAAPSQTSPAADVVDAMGLKAPDAATQPDAPRPAAMASQSADSPQAERFTGTDLTAIGDSVLLGSSRVLKRMLPGATIYATVGWQAASVLDQIKALRKAGTLTPVVLVHLGTNGYVTERQLREMLDLLADRKRVLLVNTHVPRRWMDPNNDLIDQVLPDYPNVVLVDWKDISSGHREFFVSDGVHLTVPGQKAFVGEIVRVGGFVPAPQPAAKRVVSAPPVAPQTVAESVADQSPTLVRYPYPMPLDAFWLAMARCETGTNWQNSGRFSGGLGIYLGSWKAWGGFDFAPTPAEATPEQQILVANRISTQGWIRPDGSVQQPVGFSGWGCLRVTGAPALLVFTPDSVLAQPFHLFEHGQVVRDLQALLGLPRDGIYGKLTGARHLALLKEKGLPVQFASLAQ